MKWLLNCGIIHAFDLLFTLVFSFSSYCKEDNSLEVCTISCRCLGSIFSHEMCLFMLLCYVK
uniref:Putative ovule protein n=1 Tax=Solanum chacoense TaxID=4108 RepID=A0A0V0H041_SOLCH